MSTALQPTTQEHDAAANVGGRKVKAKKKTVEETYKKLSQLEHILLRPDTYVGSALRAPAGAPVAVWDGAVDRIKARDVNYAPGLYKIFDEILVNAADHMQRGAGMKTLRVDIERENGKICVWNDGAGIPIMMHETEKVYVPELIFGHLLTSSNYDDDEKKVVGGRNGYGAKLANIFSTEFVLETADSERQKRYKQVFRKNMTDVGKPEIKAQGKKAEDWTRVSFSPDFQRFGMADTGLDTDIIDLMTKRVYDIAATNPACRVWLNGKRLPVKGFKDYVKLYHGEEPEIPFIHEKCSDRWEIAVGASDGSPEQVSFVNSICTIKGGTHVDHVVNQIVARIQDHVAKKNKGLKLKPQQIKTHLSVFVNALIENPSFDSQTKEALTSKAIKFGSKCIISEDGYKKILKSGIVENVLSYARFKQSKELAKTDGGKKARVMGIPKLDDANKAGGREAAKCTLILTEGDSAKALAVSGLSVIGRDYYGVFPLRGKLLNVREASHKQIMDNAEITNLKKIIGLQQGKKYTADTIKQLRYGHILIMTDQDHDGSHIKGLLINFFDHFWPALLKIEGFLQEFITPIVKCVKGKQQKVFFTMPEYEQWFETAGPGWKPKYYKGLGTSDAKEAKTYFSNLVEHLLTFSWNSDDDSKMIELAFAKAKVNDRKTWLTNHVPGTYFNHVSDELSYSNFINKELILFSIADNARSIPSVVDGLKPSQRKVLYACFKRNLVKNEIKVAQLAGYVGEHAAYHHGEASLQSTILGLAQNFVGSNNANYLVPAGQFGTRLQGGKDAASSRYIFTKLAPVARALHPEHDDSVLDYLEDDGMSIEPTFYCPIIPTVLLNGADGIGTGWSSSVPCYNPADLIKNIRGMIRGEEPEELTPWFRGFTGSVIPVGNSQSFDVHGSVSRVSGADDVVVVKELPIRSWTTPYKDFLESHAVGAPDSKNAPFIKEYADQGTESKVSFALTLTAEAAQQIDNGQLHKKLKLTGSLATSNMMLFDSEGRIAKYGDTTAIFKEFFKVRMDLYIKRRSFMLAELEDELECLDNKKRFILMVVNEELKVAKRKKADIVTELVKLKFKPIPKSASKGKGKGGKASGRGPADQPSRADDSDSSSSEAEGDNSSGSVTSSDFDYLLSLPLYSLTMERVAKLCTQRDGKAGERDEMKASTPDKIWNGDLDRLEVVMAEEEARASKEAVELAKAARAAHRKQNKGNTGRSKAKNVSYVGLDDDDDDANLIAPPTARVEKVKQPRKKKEPVAPSTSSSAGKDDSSAAPIRKVTKKKAEIILDEYDSDASSSEEEELDLSSGSESELEEGDASEEVDADRAIEIDENEDEVKKAPAPPPKSKAVSKKPALKRAAAPKEKPAAAIIALESNDSSDDEDEPLTLAQRLAKRDQAHGDGSSSAGMTEKSLSSASSFDSPPAATSKRRRSAGAPATEASGSLFEIDDIPSPSPRQTKKKTRILSPAKKAAKNAKVAKVTVAKTKAKAKAAAKPKAPAKSVKASKQPSISVGSDDEFEGLESEAEELAAHDMSDEVEEVPPALSRGRSGSSSRSVAAKSKAKPKAKAAAKPKAATSRLKKAPKAAKKVESDDEDDFDDMQVEAVEVKPVAARPPRRGAAKKAIVIESSDEDGEESDFVDVNDDDDSDFE